MTILIKNITSVKLFEKMYNNKNPENNENIILLIWAEWCYHSKNYIPYWTELKKSLIKNKNFKIFELKQKYKDNLEKKENKIFTQIFKKFGGYPTTIIINKKRKIVSVIGNNIQKVDTEINKCK